MPAEKAPGVWAHRAYAEAASAQLYDVLANWLRAHEPASQFVWELRDAAADERRHSTLCERRALELGWRGTLPAAAARVPTTTPQLRIVQAQIVITLCIGETLNAALLHHELSSGDRAERALTRELLRDEVRHARLGFRWLEDASRRHDLSPIAGMVSTACHDALLRLGPDAAASLASREARAHLFHETMQTTIVPALTQCGVRVPMAQRAA